jgi:PAS domain S-box-containing protein
MRILVVDDHESVRRGVLSFLRARTDFQVCGEAVDGEDAVEKAKQLRPDVILMDVNMPKLNGLNATREIQKVLPDTKVLILSQHNSAELKREALNAGARAYVDKTAISTELRSALENLEEGEGAAREESEAATVESENLFRQMIEAMPAAIYTTDLEGRLTHFNHAAVKFSGRVPELGTDQWCVTWKLYNADGTSLPHDQCPMAILLKEGRVIDGVECMAERPDGTRRWFMPFPRLLRDRRGRVVGGMNMLLDITARKVSEQANNLLAAIVDSSDDAIVSKNLDGYITSWNKSAERIFGYGAKEAIGQHITLIIPPDRRKEEDVIIRRIRAGERVDHFETVRRRKDGSYIDVSLTISPVKDASGRIVGASKVARDVTAQKRAEEALRESEGRYRELAANLDAEVRRRTKKLEEQTADIAMQSEQLRELSRRFLQTQDEERRHLARELHDSTGQLLAALQLNLTLLSKAQPKLTAEAGKYLRGAIEFADQATKEIRTASYLLHPPLLDEVGLAGALQWYTNGVKERSGLEIKLDVLDDVGRLSPEMELAVFRIVQECLTNVHRHSGSDRALIRLARSNGCVTVEVQDGGKGMPAKKLAEVQSHGSGVGLRGMQERVRQFRGKMDIESNGSGTTVKVTLPAPVEDRAAEVSTSGPELAGLKQ